jgi:hypothetical protein
VIDVPLTDWQFIVVSMVAAAALWVIVRQVWPSRSKHDDSSRAACANCPSHAESPARAVARTTTTPVVSLADLRDTVRPKTPRQ